MRVFPSISIYRRRLRRIVIAGATTFGLICFLLCIRSYFVHERITVPVGSRLMLGVEILMQDRIEIGGTVIDPNEKPDQLYWSDHSPNESQFFFSRWQLLGAQLIVPTDHSIDFKFPLSTAAVTSALAVWVLRKRQPRTCRRSGRWSTVGSAVSSVGAVVVFVLLTWSYSHRLRLDFPNQTRAYLIADNINFGHESAPQPWAVIVEKPQWDRPYTMVMGSRIHFSFLGLSYGEFGDDVPGYAMTTIPISLFAVTLMAWPLWWLTRWRRSHHPVLTCLICGYDLRATPGRCPECGAVAHGRGVV